MPPVLSQTPNFGAAYETAEILYHKTHAHSNHKMRFFVKSLLRKL